MTKRTAFSLAPDTARQLINQHGSPLFVYSQDSLVQRAEELTRLTSPFGLTPLYAAKANTHPDIIRLFTQAGLSFDASSSYEVEKLLELGVPAGRISLSSQQPAHNLDALLHNGVRYVATSLQQLQLFLTSATRDATVGLRVNPGLGAGHNNRTTTGGANSSFGLWHAYLEDALRLAALHEVRIDRLHVHIGSGADPHMWGEVMNTCLRLVERMADVTTLDIGGGFKVHRYGDEHEADMRAIVAVFNKKLIEFYERTGRQIHLEVEPGTWLVAHSGILLSTVVDIVDTGPDGHTFLRTDTGMNDIIRPSMYGAQHRIEVLNDESEQHDYVIVGHNCETGDILTPAPGDPESLSSRTLSRAKIGDIIAIYDTGAYCGPGFAATGYNAYPSAKQVII